MPTALPTDRMSTPSFGHAPLAMPRIEPRLWVSAVGALAITAAAVLGLALSRGCAPPELPAAPATGTNATH